MSYFAKPNFITYDEWFDDDLEKTKLEVQNKKIKNISNIHEFFYEQSNYKVGASENNMQLDKKLNKKELIIKNYLDNNSESYSSSSNKTFNLFKKLLDSSYLISMAIYLTGFFMCLTFLSHHRNSYYV